MCRIGSENANSLAFLCDAINSLQEEFELPINKITYAFLFPFANICNVSMMRHPKKKNIATDRNLIHCFYFLRHLLKLSIDQFLYCRFRKIILSSGLCKLRETSLFIISVLPGKCVSLSQEIVVLELVFELKK